MPASRIYGYILTFNEQRHIAEAVASLRWCDAIVVWDRFSDDRTCELARQAGATVVQHKWENFAQQRNAALAHAEREHAAGGHDGLGWVWFLDADERCAPDLALEIRKAAETDEHHVWAVPRDNYLFGTLTRHAGWYPDFQARLFLLGHSGYDPAREVHETPVFEGALGHLQHNLTHFNYDTVEQFHTKQRAYADYDAGILFKQGVRPKPRNFVLQPLREFRRRFLSLGGYKMGLHGLRLSWLCAYYNWVMYRRLAEKWQSA